MIDPHQFVISRRRKKYKFAKFANFSNCFEAGEWQERPIDVIELGAGTGLFCVELAEHHPELRYLAVDVKADRLQKGAQRAEELGLQNIWFLRARADQLPECIAPASLGSLWLTFPDPFPKKGSQKRRLTHPVFLDIYQSLLSAKGSLYLKHDNHDFFCWSMEQIVANEWQLKELCFDLHDSDLLEEYKILTTYEKRWLQEGYKTHFLRAEHTAVPL